MTSIAPGLKPSLDAMIGKLPAEKPRADLQKELKEIQKEPLSPQALSRIAFGAVEELGKLHSGREHFRFFNAEKLKIRFEAMAANQGNAEIALAEENGGIVVNSKALADMATSLVSKNLNAQELEKQLALRLAPVLAHEIRHQISNKEAKALGIAYPGALLEDEILAHTDEIKVFEEITKNNPGVIDIGAFGLQQLEMLAAWKSGFPTFKKYVAEGRSNAPSIVELPREEQLARSKEHEETLKAYKRIVEDRDAQRKIIEQEPDPIKRTEGLKALEELPTVAEFNKLLARAAAVISLLEDPEKHSKLKRFYDERMQSLAKENPGIKIDGPHAYSVLFKKLGNEQVLYFKDGSRSISKSEDGIITLQVTESVNSATSSLYVMLKEKGDQIDARRHRYQNTEGRIIIVPASVEPTSVGMTIKYFLESEPLLISKKDYSVLSELLKGRKEASFKTAYSRSYTLERNELDSSVTLTTLFDGAPTHVIQLDKDGKLIRAEQKDYDKPGKMKPLPNSMAKLEIDLFLGDANPPAAN